MGSFHMVAGIVCILLGCACLFAKEFVWNISQIFYLLEGVYAERRPSWNIQQTIVGIGCLILGGIWIYVGYQLSQVPGIPSYDQLRTMVEATATAIAK
jgi:hypothetical protein